MAGGIIAKTFEGLTQPGPPQSELNFARDCAGLHSLLLQSSADPCIAKIRITDKNSTQVLSFRRSPYESRNESRISPLQSSGDIRRTFVGLERERPAPACQNRTHRVADRRSHSSRRPMATDARFVQDNAGRA